IIRTQASSTLFPYTTLFRSAVATLLRGRAAGDDVQRHAAADQPRERVDLLHERRGLDEAGAIRDDVLQRRRGAPHRAGDEDRVGLVAAEGEKHRLDAGLLRAPRETYPSLHVRKRRRRVALRGEDARGLLRRLHRHLAALRQHPVKAEIVHHATCRRSASRTRGTTSLPKIEISSTSGQPERMNWSTPISL